MREGGPASYRVAASGVALAAAAAAAAAPAAAAAAAACGIQKKLKLVGETKSIKKKTAFVKGMFNSHLEVNRCLGAKIQTVSGIRGQIKKAIGTDGTFRASFEDKVLKSDLILCKTWVLVCPHAFYNPVLDLPGWRGLRLLSEIKKEKKIISKQKETLFHSFGKAPRKQHSFFPIRIPKQLAAKLPLHSRLKLQQGRRVGKQQQQKERDMKKAFVSPNERRAAVLLQQLETLKRHRDKRRQQQQQQKARLKQQQTDKLQQQQQQQQKERQKRRHSKQGKIEASMRKRLRLDPANTS
ncbi:ribosome biogenesis protein BMS1, putative [Eimeria tenella]|uniref:Ribosome biogenesis protein BMS1, putative n=1 Tax=Eimeria tenella TaxID=5802 RepID=U6L572_EIMTE|nr:ribosome biogenesis protein BMS1, putative [Eimeria tenella]CDJ45321.1 ribosome biogenesis protein BMS1, putative [Eimeria tenella]|eukprot:XP_013236067.1 ribosome biogenesis protein BMS1, putative [Eimeria tenella]